MRATFRPGEIEIHFGPDGDWIRPILFPTRFIVPIEPGFPIIAVQEGSGEWRGQVKWTVHVYGSRLSLWDEGVRQDFEWDDSKQEWQRK